MQFDSFRRTVALLTLFIVPVVCLSMGGCPQGGGGAVCGNGSVESGEDCDDGNTTSGDGCSASCQDEAGTCGNGTEEAGEECDDSNTVSGDGCSATCQDEDAPPDEDSDGVPDDAPDLCEGTARDTLVNADGCPDADQDSVTDEDDTCPDTRARATVDANGCADSQLDPDGDGIFNDVDACPNLPAGDVDVDEDGCPDSEGGPDDDEDGVPDDVDRCAETPAAEEADLEGCSVSQRDTDDDGINDDVDDCPTQPGPAATGGCPEGGGGSVCGNGVVEAGEQCDDGENASGDGCSATCQTEAGGPACGDGTVDSGEQCDDGNTANGDGCSSTCQSEGNDNCAFAEAVGDGTLIYSNVGATTDGPLELELCTFFGRSDIRSDLWYCYTATCTGAAVVSLCGSGYDTKLAVYSDCACPTTGSSDRVLACSDDDCGNGVENVQSRVSVPVTAGQSYLVRAGGFFGNREQGEGRLTIRCNLDTCVNGTGSCTTAHQENQPGCETASCCNAVCEVDAFCCDVTWDAFCASQASGFCDPAGFASCSSRGESCTTEGTSPGCDDSECCNAVCSTDPYCCLTAWDEGCAAAGAFCDNCGGRAGDCDTVQTTGGCGDVACCVRVCARDEFCCSTTWDQTCVDLASDLCPAP